MNCPKCNKEIERVFVYSECSQNGWIDPGHPEDGIESYDDLYVEETKEITCPCGALLFSSIHPEESLDVLTEGGYPVEKAAGAKP